MRFKFRLKPEIDVDSQRSPHLGIDFHKAMDVELSEAEAEVARGIGWLVEVLEPKKTATEKEKGGEA